MAYEPQRINTRFCLVELKSLQVRLDGNDFASPVAVLGSADRIRIDFDRIAEDRDFLRYSLVHCSARWQPSGLVDSEFLDGFNEGTIEDYDFSRAGKIIAVQTYLQRFYLLVEYPRHSVGAKHRHRTQDHHTEIYTAP